MTPCQEMGCLCMRSHVSDISWLCVRTRNWVMSHFLTRSHMMSDEESWGRRHMMRSHDGDINMTWFLVKRLDVRHWDILFQRVDNLSPTASFQIFPLRAASRMWVRHWSVVIVPPEGDLKFWWDAEMCWCFIHVTVKLVSGTTQRSVIESCTTNSFFPPKNSSPWELSPCRLKVVKKRMRRVCL